MVFEFLNFDLHILWSEYRSGSYGGKGSEEGCDADGAQTGGVNVETCKYLLHIYLHISDFLNATKMIHN